MSQRVATKIKSKIPSIGGGSKAKQNADAKLKPASSSNTAPQCKKSKMLKKVKR